VRNIEFAIEETNEAEESKGEYSELDINTLQDSNKRIHPVRGSMYWLNI
jgi:hypothetical protein